MDQETKKEFEELLHQYHEDAQQRTEQYMTALKEDFDAKLDLVMERVKDIPEMRRKLDLLLDRLTTLSSRSPDRIRSRL